MSSALANQLTQHGELCWSGALTIEHSARLRQELLAALLQAQSVTIDLNEANDVDVAVLQLLCAAQRAAVPQGKIVRLRGCARQPVRAALYLNGFRRPAPCCRECGGNCLWLISAETQQEASQ